MGFSYANLSLKKKTDGVYLVYTICKDAQMGKGETEIDIMKMATPNAYFRIKITRGAKCRFSYSVDGNNFINAGDEFQAEVGRWIGAKVGLFCTRTTQTNDSGYADFDFFRIEKLQ
jgi:hypothetical protein